MLSKKNTSNTSYGDSIAIRIFSKNPHAQSEFDKYAEIEQTYTYNELYGAQCVEITCGLKSNGLVNITYINGLLIIRTDAEVDILLSGHSPACGIHIETKGGCAIVEGPDLELPVGLYVKAKRIITKLPIASRGFITLISNQDPAEGMVEVDRPISADKVLVNTPNLLFKSKLVANSGGILSGILKVAPNGKIQIKSNSVKPINFDDLDPDYAEFRSVYLIWKEQVQEEIFNNHKSLLIADKLIYEGGLNLENAIMQIKETINFVHGCNVELNNVSASGAGLQLDKDAIMSGSNVSFDLKMQFDIDGNCNIDNLAVSCNSASASSLLWGGKSLLLDIKDTGSFNGIVGAKQTIIKYKHLLATAVLGNEGLYHETFVNGGIIGTSSLTMGGLSCVRTGGAYLYGPTIFLNNGIDVGLLSYIRTFNVVKNCLYEYCTLEGIVPCKPEYISDLINPNKLLRVTEMIGSNFPGLRGFISFLNIGKMVVSGCKTTLTTAFDSLRNDPNILRQLNNLGQAGMASVTSLAKTAQCGAESLVNLAMGEWNSERLKEFVDILLQANGLRIYAQAIASQATGSLVFVNDAQNLTYTNPDFTFENIKTTGSKAFESAKNITVSNALNATKNVGGKIAESVSTKVKVAKDVIDNPQSRSKFINDNFTVLKKNTKPANKKSEDVSDNQAQADDAANERITLAQAATDVVLNQVSEIVNAPATIFNRVTGAAEAIQSLSPAETASQLLAATNDKVDAFMTVAKAVRNAEPTPFAIEAPTIDENFLSGVAKESAKLLSPSVYTTSFVSDTGSVVFTGNYIVNAGFYRNSGMVMALGTSVHCVYDSSNYGIISSQSHTETARARNNDGILSAGDVNIYARDNNEHGATEASSSMIFNVENQYVEEGAKFVSTGQTSGHISNKMVANGQQDLRNGNLKHEGTTEFGATANTTLKSMTLDLNEEFNIKGETNLQNVYVASENPITFKNTSNTNVNNVVLNAPSVYREDGSVINVDNNLLFDAEHVGSGLNSTLNGTADSLFGIKSNTLDELGSHAVGDGVFNIAALSPEDAHKLAYSLDEHQNKTYDNSIRVVTESSEPITYRPSVRADGAVTTLLTKGVVTLPAEYGRARGMEFNTYSEAERFVAGYGTYDMPDMPSDKKNTSQKVYETVNDAAKVASGLGASSFSVTGLVVFVVGGAISLFSGHKARRIQEKRNAAIEAEAKRRADMQRDIDQHVLELDERAELAELYNIRNTFRFNNFFQELVSSSDLNSDSNDLTMQNIEENRQNITASYESRRLELNNEHDKYKNELDKHFAARREQINRTGDIDLYVGAAANFGSNGYTVSVTYGGGSGRNMGYSKVPIYDKTYNSYETSQKAMEADYIRQDTYDFIDLKYDNLEFNRGDSGLVGAHSQDYSIVDVDNHIFSSASDQMMDQDSTMALNNENFIQKRHNLESSPEIKSWGRKLGDFFHDVMMDADEVQLDYWDVPSTPELNEGRAAIVRGFGSGTANAIQPILHPIDAVTDLVVTTWDGMNELSNLAFGVANQESLQRGQKRGRQTLDAINMVKDASAIQKIEIGSEFLGTMLFGYGVGIGTRGSLNKVLSMRNTATSILLDRNFPPTSSSSGIMSIYEETILNNWQSVKSSTAKPKINNLKHNKRELTFKPGEDLNHFNQHQGEISKKFGFTQYTLQEYIADAKFVVNNGYYVPELNGFVTFPTGSGNACAPFVGLDRITGEITTFHLKDIRILERKAPSLGWHSKSQFIDLVGPNEHLGWKTPYIRNKL